MLLQGYHAHCSGMIGLLHLSFCLAHVRSWRKPNQNPSSNGNNSPCSQFELDQTKPQKNYSARPYSGLECVLLLSSIRGVRELIWVRHVSRPTKSCQSDKISLETSTTHIRRQMVGVRACWTWLQLQRGLWLPGNRTVDSVAAIVLEAWSH